MRRTVTVAIVLIVAACGGDAINEILDPVPNAGAQEDPPKSISFTEQCTLIKHDVAEGGNVTVDTYYAMVDAGPDPTKVWVHANVRPETHSLRRCAWSDGTCAGAILDDSTFTTHYQPSDYADGLAVVTCGSVSEVDGQPTQDNRRFLEFEVEIKP